MAPVPDSTHTQAATPPSNDCDIATDNIHSSNTLPEAEKPDSMLKVAAKSKEHPTRPKAKNQPSHAQKSNVTKKIMIKEMAPS